MNIMKNYKSLRTVIMEVVKNKPHQDLPFEGPTKPASKGNPMDKAKKAARKGLKGKMKESFDLDITDEQADDIIESIITDTQGE